MCSIIFTTPHSHPTNTTEYNSHFRTRGFKVKAYVCLHQHPVVVGILREPPWGTVQSRFFFQDNSVSLNVGRVIAFCCGNIPARSSLRKKNKDNTCCFLMTKYWRMTLDEEKQCELLRVLLWQTNIWLDMKKSNASYFWFCCDKLLTCDSTWRKAMRATPGLAVTKYWDITRDKGKKDCFWCFCKMLKSVWNWKEDVLPTLPSCNCRTTIISNCGSSWKWGQANQPSLILLQKYLTLILLKRRDMKYA